MAPLQRAPGQELRSGTTERVAFAHWCLARVPDSRCVAFPQLNRRICTYVSESTRQLAGGSAERCVPSTCDTCYWGDADTGPLWSRAGTGLSGSRSV